MKRYLKDGKKHVQCAKCGKEWLVGRKGGGLIVGSVIRHEETCKGEKK